MEMVGAILFAVLLYVITTELSLFVARRRARAVPRQTRAAGSGVLSLRKTRHLFDGPRGGAARRTVIVAASVGVAKGDNYD
jgi:hypothetical protein